MFGLQVVCGVEVGGVEVEISLVTFAPLPLREVRQYLDGIFASLYFYNY